MLQEITIGMTARPFASSCAATNSAGTLSVTCSEPRLVGAALASTIVENVTNDFGHEGEMFPTQLASLSKHASDLALSPCTRYCIVPTDRSYVSDQS